MATCVGITDSVANPGMTLVSLIPNMQAHVTRSKPLKGCDSPHALLQASSPWLATTTTISKSTSSQLSMDTTEFQHDDFEVIRKDDRYRGFEEVKLVNRNYGEMSVSYFPPKFPLVH